MKVARISDADHKDLRQISKKGGHSIRFLLTLAIKNLVAYVRENGELPADPIILDESKEEIAA